MGDQTKRATTCTTMKELCFCSCQPTKRTPN